MQGTAASCALPGGLHVKGEMVRQDYVPARKFLERACSCRMMVAAVRLRGPRNMTAQGRVPVVPGPGSTVPKPAAGRTVLAACLQGEPYCPGLGLRDAGQAREYYGRARDAGHQPGCGACAGC